MTANTRNGLWLAVLVCSIATGVQADEFTEHSTGIVTFRFAVEAGDPNDPSILDVWHTDIDLPFRACRFGPAISHDNPGGPLEGTIFEPNEATLFVSSGARFQLPSIPPGFDFIGAEPNQVFWILPQTQNPVVLYLGWASELMRPQDLEDLSFWNPGDSRGGANVNGRWLQVQMVDMRGPAGGDFSMWQTNGGAPTVYFSSFENGIDATDVYYQAGGGHDHYNLGFTKQGFYEIDLEITTFLVHPRGDTNCDTRVDGMDLVELPDSLAGPQQFTPPNPLNWFDFDRDADVDMRDVLSLQIAAE